MCTLSYLRLADGFSVMMNRDESPLRPQPEEIRQGNVEGSEGEARRVLYPVDPKAGGTWIGVNDAGVVLALLNQHPEGYQRPANALSRGRLIPEGLRAGSAIHGLERVAQLDLSATPPFLLVGLDTESPPFSLRWDGHELERRMHPEGAFQVSSSSYKPGEILPVREANFDLMLNSIEGKDASEVLAAQEAYHFSEDPEPGPAAVWMTRDDARTISYSHLLVQPKHSLFRYLDRNAKETGQDFLALRLPRA